MFDYLRVSLSRKYIIYCFIVFFFCVRGYSECSLDTVKGIFSMDSSISTFEADFVQQHKNRAFRNPQKSSGRIFIKNPDLFKIHSIEPREELLIMNGNSLISFDPETKARRERKIDGYTEDLRLFYLFNVDYDDLNDAYFIRCIEEEDVYRVNLAPRNMNLQKRLLNIIISVSKKDLMIRNISYFLRNEEEIHISFSNISVNKPLDEDLFSLEAE